MAESDLELQARIEIQIRDDVAEFASHIGRLNQEVGGLSKVGNTAERVVANLDTKLKGMTGAAGAATTATTATAGAVAAQGAASAAAAAATKAHTTSLIAARYALYDVSNALGVAGLGLTAFSVLAFKAAIDYQRDFAQVVRTTGVAGTEATALNKALIDLSRTLPSSFGDITAAATLAGQLGIANDEVSAFTKSTVEFAATTNVSVEDTATAFGRLNALLPDVRNNYNGLGSSILKVGINSVATESQIISITTRLAGIASAAGLTSDEVIGLSGALASIGIQPELAQGTITRLFTKIQVAISSGGAALEDFGRISGQTGAQFAAAWNANPTAALQKMLEGINAQGPAAIEALRGLGITSARDIPTMLKLAQNTDILHNSLLDAADGMKKGTQLGESYGIIADTVAAKLKVLVNNFNALMATLGNDATGIGGFLDTASGFLKWLDAVSHSPIASELTTIGVGLTLITGLAALAGAAFLRLAATAAAVATASATAGASGNLLSAAWTILTGSATRAALSQTVLGDTTTAAGAAAARSTVLFTAEGGSLDKLTLSGTAAAGGVGLVTKAVIGLSAILGLGVADQLFKMGDAALNNKLQFTDAANALKEYNKQVEAGMQHRSFIPSAGGDRGDILQSTTGVNREVQNFTKDTQPVPVVGWLTGIAGRGSGLTQAQESIDKIDASMAKLVKNGNFTIAAQEFQKWADAGKMAGVSADDVASKFPLYAAAQKAAGKAAKDAVPSQQDLVDSIKDAIGAITDDVDATVKIQDALFNLGGTLQAGGNDFSTYSDAGRANLQALESVMAGFVADAGGNSQVLANNLQGLFNALTQGAGVPTAALGMLSQAIASLGVKSIVPTSISLDSLREGFNKSAAAAKKAGTAAAKAAHQVHTLVDYANDLQSVFSRSFDLRFGGQQGMDAVSSGWATIRDNIESTNEQIRQYRDDMASLTADKKVKEYWLSVAENYGDALRAGELRAELGKIDGDLAKDSKDLSKAQEKNSKTLVGNSEAATENRDEILGLVKNYEGYITALASSGMSQADLSRKTAQLKADFIAQATQLGFNQNELGQYANAFDDVATAINKVPRNITVGFNADPALQALAEFAAKAATAGSAAGAGFAGGVQEGMAKAARGAQLQAQIASWQATLNRAVASGADNQGQRALDNITRLSALLNSGNYWSGGYVGDGGKYQPMGIVHGGEFVFTKEETAAIGPQNLQNLASMAFSHNMSKGSSAPAAGTSSGFGSGVVQLSPYDRQLLIDIRDRQGITISGTALQRTASAGNINSNNRGAA